MKLRQERIGTMNDPTQPMMQQPGVKKFRWRSRRGVVAILAMMFLVLFSSLGIAMGISSKGNLRTAASHVHVVRAIGAAETGLAIAESRLAEAASRFVISNSEMNGSLVTKIWRGTVTSSDTTFDVLPASTFVESSTPAGIAQALVNRHAADGNVATVPGTVTVPAVVARPANASSTIYAANGWVVTPPIAIDTAVTDTAARPAAFAITYAPLADGTTIRIVVTGYSSIGSTGSNYSYANDGNTAPVTRTITRDYQLTKRHQHAVISPSRVLIGQNVQIDGPVGAGFEAVDSDKGDPLVMKSDFYDLSTILDRKLDDFFAGVRDRDTDGDQRLRRTHPLESLGLPPATRDYDNNGSPDNAFADFTGDGFVDDYDIFLNHYDLNRDGKVVLSAALTLGTANETAAAEFTVNDDLARMIDACLPDRNRNGTAGFQDSNRNGRWDAGENLNDFDSRTATYPDRVLGYRDGVLDRKDPYAKVRGQLNVRVTKTAWEDGQDHDYQSVTQGAVLPGRGVSPIRFGIDQRRMPDPSPAELAAASAPLKALADGQSLAQQAATQLGVSATAMTTYTEAKTDNTQPRFFRPDMPNASVVALTGQNIFEKAPFNSPTFTDWYYRPRYENMVFKNVRIPAGTNALFVNCTFVGVTAIETNQVNTHTNWPLYGRMQWSSTQNRPVPIDQPLDKSDFLRYTTGNVADGPANYNDFPDPPVINGTTRTGAARDTKLYSNNIRFHNCLIVGSLVSDMPQVFNPVRNKVQFTGSTRFSRQHPTAPGNTNLNPDAADLGEIDKSSLMMPQYSVEIGQFNSPTDTFAGGPAAQNVALRGTIIAGVLDARGNTDIEGTLLMTFKPVRGVAPLNYNGQAIGNPANFNISLGYFGPDDGDEEAMDPKSLPEVGGVKIVGYDTDGDGLPDVGPNEPQPAGSTIVPFYGLGRVTVRYNPDLKMPNGIMLPISVVPVRATYREGSY
jgi:hypothetical protein